MSLAFYVFSLAHRLMCVIVATYSLLSVLTTMCLLIISVSLAIAQTNQKLFTRNGTLTLSISISFYSLIPYALSLPLLRYLVRSNAFNACLAFSVALLALFCPNQKVRSVFIGKQPLKYVKKLSDKALSVIVDMSDAQCANQVRSDKYQINGYSLK